MKEQPIPYQIIRSDRKTISIQITLEGQVMVRCPKRMPCMQANQIQGGSPW